MIILSDGSMEASTETVPLSYDDVADRIDALGPFEASPHVAVAVSGGRDSMALCMLLHQWALQCGGRVSAITVDHQLRPESAEEAKQVGHWLEKAGIDHHVLVLSGLKPTSGVQAAARTARYNLMEDWCRNAGVLHLFLGHHRDDQAETVLFRLQHDSGIDGLAGMSSIREQSHIRLLRPLLDIPRERITVYLQSHKQSWIEDPSNDNPKYARTQLRAQLRTQLRSEPKDVTEGELTAEHLIKLSGRCARARMALEQETARTMAQCCSITPIGFAHLDDEKFRAVPVEISLRVLSQTIQCVGGRAYRPKQAQLERLHDLILKGRMRRSRTLGGCQVSCQDGALLVVREYRNLPASKELTAGESVVWDNRFRVELNDRVFQVCDRIWLEAVGRKDQEVIKAVSSTEIGQGLPSSVTQTLPALWDRQGLAFVPHVNYVRDDLRAIPQNARKVTFQPHQGLGGSGFAGFMLQEQPDILSL